MNCILRCSSLFLFFCCQLFFTSCVKLDNVDGYDTLSKGAKAAYERYNSIVKRETFSETFLFFTDPHLLKTDNVFSDEEKNTIIEAFSVAKELFDTLKLNFCLCGGDWLNYSKTQAIAKEKLLFADRQMKLLFSRYYKMLGNHDTNYQGIVSVDNNARGDLPRDFIDKEYFNETGSAYYSFWGSNTLFYVLDSGLDWTPAMDKYRWEQVKWLSAQLLKTQSEHMVLCLHMFRIKDITPMSKLLVDLIDAFKSRRTITLGGEDYGEDYDYSMVKGKIHFVISGHNHEDGLIYVGENTNIPVIQTCNYTIDGKSTFDICAVNYEKSVLKLIRVGFGEDREVQIL